MDNNVIIWEKWVDPFGREIEEKEEDADSPFLNDDDEEEISSKEEEHLEKLLNNKKIIPGIKVIATPMGIVPINEDTSSGKIFNFWVGHTNFDITRKIAETLEKIRGVETLDIFTRYRFRISIGKGFSDSKIMRNINTIIYEEASNV